ncbi:MAG TPA: pepsin/retropepsin-like aspartic protease family protein [Rhizomicrobium sp.]|jgi:predicted aspartyl protease
MQPHHSIRARFLLALLILAGLVTGVARAETCPPLRLLNQTQMLAINDGMTMLVPVTINTVDKLMILDTGASASSVTRALAQELNISVHPNVRSVGLYDINGNVSYDFATIANFKFGQQEVRDTKFRIWPNPDLGKVDPRLAGILSLDRLLQYDIDVDFANGVLKLFSPEHCEGNVLYWKAAAVSVGGFDTRGDHINVQVSLDGQKMNAIIDSGAVSSILSADIARRLFGLTATSPGMKQSGIAMGNPLYPVYRHQFSKLEFDGVLISNPDIAIWPNVISRSADRTQQSTENRAIPRNTLSGVNQLIIGMDILRKLHLYIASQERHIYVSASPGTASSSK